MARQIHGVVYDHVDLLHAHHHTSDATDETETDRDRNMPEKIGLPKALCGAR